ncbi:hypothetical protein HF1_01860 [Mycoplasma haemofelis str. Langford 1]|nr:hypothetical protein HF1_01860 [Mycoplasma haemofelis str. Langford 1]
MLAGGTGAAGLATYGGYSLLKEDSHEATSLTIWQVVSPKKEKFVLSVDTTSHDKEWEEIVKSINNETKVKNVFGGKVLTKEELKDWCSKNKTESSDDEGLLEDYESWCTKASNFGQLKTLNKEALGEGDSQTWETNFSNYKSSANTDNRITDASGAAKNDSNLSNKEELINWCNGNARSLYQAESATSKAYVKWCTKDTKTAVSPTPASEA